MIKLDDFWAKVDEKVGLIYAGLEYFWGILGNFYDYARFGHTGATVICEKCHTPRWSGEVHRCENGQSKG